MGSSTVAHCVDTLFDCPDTGNGPEDPVEGCEDAGTRGGSANFIGSTVFWGAMAFEVSMGALGTDCKTL